MSLRVEPVGVDWPENRMKCLFATKLVFPKVSPKWTSVSERKLVPGKGKRAEHQFGHVGGAQQN